MNPQNIGQAMPENFEVAQLVVENPGRTAITVYSPGVYITGHGKKNHTISPRMFKLEDFGPDNATTEGVVRIEPYDRVTFLLDYWSIIPGLLAEAGQAGIVVRGFVSVAGRTKKPQKSDRRLRWRIPQGGWTAYAGRGQISPRTVMWRELYRSYAGTDTSSLEDGRISKSMLGHLLFEAMRKFEKRPSREDLQQALEETSTTFGAKYSVLGLASWQMYEALDRHAGHLSAWTWKPSPEAPEGD